MDRELAHTEAIDMLRRRLAKGWARQQIVDTIFEGSCGPSSHGYLIRGGRIYLPHPRDLRPESAEHSFALGELIDEIESPQGVLFG